MQMPACFFVCEDMAHAGDSQPQTPRRQPAHSWSGPVDLALLWPTRRGVARYKTGWRSGSECSVIADSVPKQREGDDGPANPSELCGGLRAQAANRPRGRPSPAVAVAVATGVTQQ